MGNAEDLAPPSSLEGALQNALAAASTAFTGEVVSIDRTPAAVVVRWRVEDPVRGVSAGSVFEQKEWPGLWVDGNARAVVGERALVLLHAPSAAGYASPVQDGVIPLHGDAVTGTLDLRWVARQVAVTDAARLRPMLALEAADGNLGLAAALQAQSARTARAAVTTTLAGIPQNSSPVTGRGVVLVAAPASANSEADPNAQVDSAMVLGMLHAWQRAGAAAR